MIQIIEKDQLELHLIPEDARENFVHRTDSVNLTLFESFWLKKTGDLLRPKDSQYFWCNDSYCWWVTEYDANGNPTRDHEFSVWLDTVGNCMYENHYPDGKLYRVMF